MWSLRARRSVAEVVEEVVVEAVEAEGDVRR